LERKTIIEPVSDYNIIAPIYDFLKTLVFGRNILKSQTIHLGGIPSNHRILILGGGTGQVLEYLGAQTVDYVESSSRMIHRAEKRKYLVKAKFLCQQFEDFQSSEKYDVVISNYFLDLFSDLELAAVIEKIKNMIADDGALLVADFKRTDYWYHHFLEWSMHLFFRQVTGLKRRRLANIEKSLRDQGFTVHQRQLYFGGFIFSSVMVVR